MNALPMRPRNLSRRAWTAAFLATFPWCAAAASEAASPLDFNRDIRPLLADRCLICHGPDEATREAGLRLDAAEFAFAELPSGAKAIVPGAPEQSELIARITSDDPDLRMPPPDSGKSLSPHEVELLRRWVASGSDYAAHWAFAPIVRPTPPEVRRSAWVANPIDQFVLARLEQEGLAPAPEAPPEKLVRRLSFDLVGLPPTLAEVDAYLADASPEKQQRLVSRLMESPHYGERMAIDWLDAARYADSNGYQNDFARSMWPWRDWVIQAFNDHMPFDQFTIEQLAGDLLESPTLNQRVATGFNRNHRMVTEAGSIDEEWRIENVLDRVETTGTAFLGLTLGCARCHDHKYDPIPQRDMYAVAAFFNSVNEQGVYTETRGNVPPLVKLPTAEQTQQLDVLTHALAEVDRELASAGEQVAEPLRQKREELQRQREDVERRIQTTMVMEDLPEPRPTYVLKRGAYDAPDLEQPVEPGTPACLPPLPEGAPRNRLGFARWVVDPQNPLTARVIVNRLWQRFFGVGLVKTTENFGVQAEPPSHPELLDWLASELIGSQWDLQHVQRLIVSSATYRQSSAGSMESFARDPENRLLSRGPRHRLPAELVRDNALALSGLLNPTIGGPSVMPYQPENLWEELAGGAHEDYVQDTDDKLYRRSLYVYRKRTVPHPTMSTFDAPSWEICLVKRSRTNTPLQALALLNDVTYVEAARKFGERMLLEGGDDPDARVAWAFRTATGRAPGVAEQRQLLRSLETYLAHFSEQPAAAEEWLSHGLAPRSAAAEPRELAAYAALGSVLLNLDETITKD